MPHDTFCARDPDAVLRLLTALFEQDESFEGLLQPDEALDAPGRRSPGRERDARPGHDGPLYEALRVAGMRVVNVYGAERTSVVELQAELTRDGVPVLLPVAVLQSQRDGRPWTRVYHSARLLTGVRAPRRPIIPVAADARPTPAGDRHPALRAYDAAQRTGSPQRVAQVFTSDAFIDNGPRRVAGDVLRRVLEKTAPAGAPDLIVHSQTESTSAVGLEYTILGSRSAPDRPATPSRGGFAAYLIAAPDRLRGIRTYDDFDPDALIST